MKTRVSQICALSFVLVFCVCCEQGKLYLTADTYPGMTIRQVSYGDPGFNAERAENISADYEETVEYGGYTWRVYNIPNGDWDIYVEWTGPGSCSDRCNEREGVYIEPGSSSNEWFGMWIDPTYGYDMRSESGGGGFSLLTLD